jgi:hypothetical protein
MNIKTLILIFSFLLMSGCSTLVPQQPTKLALQGKWESTGPFSYYQLVISENDNGSLTVVHDNDHIKIYKLEELRTLEKSFEAIFNDTEGKEEPFTIFGALISGRLVLEGTANHNEKVWFLKNSDLDNFRTLANEAMNK